MLQQTAATSDDTIPGSHIAIDAQNVTLSLGEGDARVDILGGITLAINAGSTVALLGPSGSGKSSLMAILSGLERASGGTVNIAGADFGTMNEDELAIARRGRVGIVLQAFHLLPTMTALASHPDSSPVPRMNVGTLEKLRTQVQFAIDGVVPDEILRFDPGQVEQALLNLLKNAHESGSANDAVAMAVRRTADGWRIDVLDRGSGMNESVLANALLPFYSTKRSGTGLGLALAREIAEAHGGRIALLNRDGGGLCVSMVLPGKVHP